MRSSYILEPRSSSLAPNRSEGRTPFCISHRSQQRPGPPRRSGPAFGRFLTPRPTMRPQMRLTANGNAWYYHIGSRSEDLAEGGGLRIREFEWDEGNILHLTLGHGIEPDEAEEALAVAPSFAAPRKDTTPHSAARTPAVCW